MQHVIGDIHNEARKLDSVKDESNHTCGSAGVNIQSENVKRRCFTFFSFAG